MSRLAVAASCLAAFAAHAGGITVELASVTLSDSCGGHSEAPEPAKKEKSLAKADMARICDQSSMQLAIDAAEAGELSVKSVELVDDQGVSVGKLTWKAPSVFVEGAYRPWDQKIAAGKKLSVTYPLSQAALGADRFNKTYTLKVSVAVGGADKALQKTVQLQRPTVLPPGVKT